MNDVSAGNSSPARLRRAGGMKKRVLGREGQAAVSDLMGWSAFIPLVIAGAVVSLGLLVAFVPLVDCPPCDGMGTVSAESLAVSTARMTCRWCDGVGTVKLKSSWEARGALDWPDQGT